MIEPEKNVEDPKRTVRQLQAAPKAAYFTRFARWTSKQAGRPSTFVIACSIVAVWLLTGPYFKYSDTWQLVINTGTTVVTFLMVFLIQHSQNQDTTSVQIKLDELIRTIEGAHNSLLGLEELGDEELEEVRREYAQLAKKARERLRDRGEDTGRPELEANGMLEKVFPAGRE